MCRPDIVLDLSHISELEYSAQSNIKILSLFIATFSILLQALHDLPLKSNLVIGKVKEI